MYKNTLLLNLALFIMIFDLLSFPMALLFAATNANQHNLFPR